MREIKFRGKGLKGDWVTGQFHTYGDGSFICQTRLMSNDGRDWRVPAIEVISESVGQFTGLLAEKRKTNLDPEIYEGDIFRSQDDDIGIRYHVVMWIEQRAAFYMVPIGHYGVMTNEDVSKEKEFDWLFQEAALYDFSIDCGLTKVGNIHDNPELLNA